MEQGDDLALLFFLVPIYLTAKPEPLVSGMEQPRTLLQAVQYFADFANCRAFMMELRWPDGRVACPTCGSEYVVWLDNARVWKCYAKHPKAKFSLKTGTIFEDSPLGLDTWLAAVWLVVNCTNGISSYEMARNLGVTQKSAWFMNHRIRLALHAGAFDKLSGHVEADETFDMTQPGYVHS
jgi:transposase-like protein